MRRPTKRGIWKQIDGHAIRFALDRKSGLRVRRRGKPEKLVSFEDLLDVAEGQLRMNLL